LTVVEILETLAQRGVKVGLRDGSVELEAPDGTLDDEFLAQLRANKAEIVAVLERASRNTSAIATVPRWAGTSYPLTAAQRRMFFLWQWSPRDRAYALCRSWILSALPDRRRLAGAVAALTQRHEALRTRLILRDGEPRQLIAENVEALQQEQLDGDLETGLARWSERPFDLLGGPLFRVALLADANNRCALAVAAHHIVVDAWSLDILVEELGALYCGEAPPAPALQAVDCAVWQEQRTFDRQLAYWKKRLAGLEPADLPADLSRPHETAWSGDAVGFVFPAALTRGVRAFCREQRTSLFVVAAAAVLSLIGRLTGRSDVAVGFPIANRAQGGLEGVVGLFVNTLVLRADLSGHPSFAHLVETLHAAVLDGHRNADLPFEAVVEAMAPRRDPGRTPLFNVMLETRSSAGAELRLPGIVATPCPRRVSGVKCDLTFVITERGDDLELRLEYRTDLFARPRIEQACRLLSVLWQAGCAEPERPVAELPWLDPQDQRVLQVGRSAAPAATMPVHRSVAAMARSQPTASAVEDQAGHLTYFELDAAADGLAGALAAHGVGPGQRIGVCMQRSTRFIVAALAVLKTGATYVPLALREPTQRRLAIARDAGLVLVLVDDAGRDALDGAGLPLLSSAATAPAVPAAEKLGPAYVVYTSGSTGAPKGVVVSHDALAGHIAAIVAAYGITPQDRVLQFASCGFDLSLEEIFGTLVAGATLVLHSEQRGLSGSGLARIIRERRITTLSLPTAVWSLWLNELPSACEAGEELRAVVIGTEQCDWQDLCRWGQLFGERVRLFNGYGPTEATVTATVWEYSDAALHSLPGRRVPIGRPIGDTQLLVLDDALQPMPIGVPGELFIGGGRLADGYLGDAILTGQRFIQRDGQRLYRTGDRARFLADGNLEWLERIDDQVKIRGLRIETGEIEAALRADGSIAHAAVVVDGGRLTGFIVPRNGSIDLGALRARLRARLSEEMIPATLHALETLPLGANGKVDREALRREASTLPVELRESGPLSPAETMVREAWAAVLGLPVAAIGRDDHFFDLGGHSLLVAKMIARLPVAPPLSAVFHHPRLKDFAAATEQAGAIGPAAIGRTDSSVMSFAQARLWFICSMAPHDTSYHVTLALRLEGALDVAALALAIDGLEKTHPTLRTVFPAAGGEPRPVVRPARRGILRREPTASRLEADREAPFDLACGPLFRASLLEMGPRLHLLQIVLHHIVADGWSIDVLARDLSALYAAACRGTGMEPVAQTSYADYAAWQRAQVLSGMFDDARRYWLERLAGLPSLNLPTDRPRPQAPGGPAGQVHFVLASETVARLEALRRRCDASLLMLLAGGVQLMLSRYCRESDIPIGIAVAGRPRAELEDIVGMFANTLVVRGDLSGNPTVAEFIARLRRAMLADYDRQDLPFDHLVEALQPERAVNRTPLVDVMVSLQPAAGPACNLPEVTVTRMPVAPLAAKFDVTVFFEHGDGLGGRIEYNAALFDATTIERMAGHLGSLLKEMAAKPDAPICALDMLTPGERAQLGAWNATAREPEPESVQSLVERQVRRRPNALAVRDGEKSTTYAALNAAANRRAWTMIGRGIGPGDVVAVVLDRSIAYVECLLAVLKTGAAYLSLDPAQPAERLASTLRSAAPDLVIDDPLALLEGDRSDDPPCRAGPDDLSYVVYTSGTTGEPKGAELEHRGLLNLVLWHRRYYGIHEADRATLLASPGFDASTWEVWPNLAAGAALEVASDALRLAPTDLVRWLVDREVTVTFLSPAVADPVLIEPWPERTALRLLLTGGERIIRRPRPGLPFRLFNNYGPAETTVLATAGEVLDAGCASAIPDIGRPIDNVRIHLLDDFGNPVPVGVPGQIWIGGAGVGRGYRHNPAETAAAFVPDRFADVSGARLYRTGDLAKYRSDGSLEFVGRVDRQVKLRGVRIETAEIETLIKVLPGVQDATVVLRDDGDSPYLAAYVVVADTGHADMLVVRRHLQRHLLQTMVPRTIVALEALPLTRNGKVDHARLPSPERRRGHSALQPRTDAERTIAAVWQELLAIDAVGVEDNFFDLGGHSLQLVQVQALLRQRAAVDVTLLDLLRRPTVSGLAALIDGNADEATTALQAEARNRANLQRQGHRRRRRP
jgi:amino acid adenylation domain-containing protein